MTGISDRIWSAAVSLACASLAGEKPSTIPGTCTRTCWVADGRCQLAVVIHSDFERSQKPVILRGQLDLSCSFEPAFGLLRGLDLLFVLVFGIFVPSIEADRGFQDQKDVVTGFLNFADRLRDPVGLGQGIVDRVSQFLHQMLQWLVHRVLPYGGCTGSTRRSHPWVSVHPFRL